MVVETKTCFAPDALSARNGFWCTDASFFMSTRIHMINPLKNRVYFRQKNDSCIVWLATYLQYPLVLVFVYFILPTTGLV